MKRIRIPILIVAVTLFLNVGCCKLEQISDKKTNDVDFTVVSFNEMPNAVRELVSENKKNPFLVAYTNEADTYIIITYGKQKYKDYKITVENLYETKNAIKIKTKLQGPKKYTNQEIQSYPYIVVKIERTDKNIIFSE